MRHVKRIKLLLPVGQLKNRLKAILHGELKGRQDKVKHKTDKAALSSLRQRGGISLVHVMLQMVCIVCSVPIAYVVES